MNLYAGPGAGKSTTAAVLYAELKQADVNSELVREYVKEWAWEGRRPGVYDQFYFFGKHVRKETILLNKADVIITDSPVLLSGYYANKYSTSLVERGISGAVERYRAQVLDDGHQFMELWVDRTKPYNPSGRFQSEEESRAIDQDIRQYLWSNGVFTAPAIPVAPVVNTILAHLG